MFEREREREKEESGQGRKKNHKKMMSCYLFLLLLLLLSNVTVHSDMDYIKVLDRPPSCTSTVGNGTEVWEISHYDRNAGNNINIEDWFFLAQSGSKFDIGTRVDTTATYRYDPDTEPSKYHILYRISHNTNTILQ